MRVSRLGWLVAVLLWGWLSAVAVAEDSCGRPGNLTHNCNFNSFVDRGGGVLTPDGWMPWVVMGSPAFDIDDHGSAPGAPAQRIWSDGGTWTAGLYQQVPVTPGKGYTARIDWAAPRVFDVERKIGVDPYGGTDPLSPHVVWSRSEWAIMAMPDLQVSIYAGAPTLSIFVWTHHPVSHGADEVFLDAVTLVEDPSMPLRATNTPTPPPTVPPPTRRPPTSTPVPPPATETPTSTPSPLPTETPTSLPADTPAPTPSPIPTDTPMPVPPTATPTATPSLTPLPVAQVVRTSPPQPAVQVQRIGSQEGEAGEVFLYVMGAAVAGAVVLAALVLVLWLRARQPVRRGD